MSLPSLVHVRKTCSHPKPRRARRRARIAVSIQDGAFTLVPEKNFYSTDEVAEIFSVSKRTVDRWIDEGRLDAVRPAYRRLVTAASVMALLMGGWKRRFDRTEA